MNDSTSGTIMWWLLFWLLFIPTFGFIMLPRDRRFAARLLMSVLPFYILVVFVPLIWADGKRINIFFDLIVHGSMPFTLMLLGYLMAWMLLFKRRLVFDIGSLAFHIGGNVSYWWGVLTHFPDAVPKADPSFPMLIVNLVVMVGQWLNYLLYWMVFLSDASKKLKDSLKERYAT